MCFAALSKVSTNLHQSSQIRFVEICVDLWTGRECCQYPVLPMPVFNTNKACLGYGGKLRISNIGNVNIITLATLNMQRIAIDKMSSLVINYRRFVFTDERHFQ